MAIYLYFDGGARDAIALYKDALGAEVQALMSFAEVPDGTPVSESMKDRVMHARLVLPGQILMISDTHSPAGTTRHGGFHIQIETPDLDAAAAMYAALSEDGEQTMPFGPTFWAKGFGTCRDRFGVPWMINCEQAPA